MPIMHKSVDQQHLTRTWNIRTGSWDRLTQNLTASARFLTEVTVPEWCKCSGYLRLRKDYLWFLFFLKLCLGFPWIG
ncbi:hypothetical protein SETIT_4G004300v2 [Setaria italica]|uniref:Uncharacterized protein n=1 Tax=Setaria italica TaxID=4555 RepID=A0A368QPB0_SETIT|nr:hypothetical protein SETIT_4G004300v2 [Setaria italica]